MKKTITITISRQFGSNGREIGRKLAEYLDIGYYNKEIMEKIAKDMGVSSDFFNEDNQNEDGLYSISNRKLRSFGSIAELSVNSQVFERATDLICGIAQRESSVIVGRCADYILKDNPDTISVFCFSDLEERIRFSINEYDVPAKKAKKIVQEKDMKRARFYEFHTNQKWGDAKNYSLLINTSKMSTDEVVEIIAALYDKKAGLTTFKGAFQDQYIEHKSFKI
ncbi:AAA family ATPase [Faecalitalea cylindroides]|uniref:cytidylate kinase-like family protein n=1 Tax=Faecalitalea cylindroides TaxID=39483 RepID=UPI0039F596D6